MINNTVGELAELLGARLDLDGRAPDATELSAQVTELVYDSRKAGPGSLFVAFPGEHVDGHDYAAKAWRAGAVAAITARPVAGGLCLVVDDPQAAMGIVGRHVVATAKQRGLTVLGITGSAGKTTTKDLLAQILERVGTVVAPRESMNNEIGLPVTASWVTADTEYLVSEMGAKGIGHIGYLCSITPPDIGLELNVGIAHLGKFGSQDAIARAKGELVEALPTTGRAVLNAGDRRVREMADRTSAPVISFGVEGDQLPDGVRPDVFASGLTADDLDRWGFDLRIAEVSIPVRLTILGRHQVANAVAAAAAAHAVGVDAALIADTLSAIGLRSHWRMELHELPGGAVLINDAYNANPTSMQAALATMAGIGGNLRAAGRSSRLIAVLGEMLELGADSDRLHREVGAMVAEAGIDRLITVGAGAELIAAGATTAGMVPDAVVPVADKASAAKLLDGVGSGDVVLIKASRDIGLESLGEQLLDPAPREA